MSKAETLHDVRELSLMNFLDKRSIYAKYRNFRSAND